VIYVSGIAFGISQKTRLKMDKFLQAIGFTRTSATEKGRKIYQLQNPDGSPRWLWNAENPKPDFLRFYAVSNLRSNVFSILIKGIFFLKLQHLFFKKNSISVLEDDSHILFHYLKSHFALFTGTEGPNRKLVLFANKQFIKIALNENSSRLIEQEKAILHQVNRGQYLEIPNCKNIGDGILALSDLGDKGKRINTFTLLHAKALKELTQYKLRENLPFSNTEIYQNCLQNLDIEKEVSFDKVPKQLTDNLKTLAISLSKQTIITHFAHGDFTPWNCFVEGEKIRLYDFELAHENMPFGFDAFHFVMQQGILVDHLPYKAIKPKLIAAFEVLSQEANSSNMDFNACYKAYLLVNTSYYLRIYSQQEKWHTQVNWLLNTWNESISDVLSSTESQRSLLIGNVFDFVQNQKYAAIKFPNIHPTSLSEYADIDLLIEKSTAQNLLQYLKQHILVKRLNIQPQSHMMSIVAVLQDGSLLALDLIWQLKRKSLAFMNVSEAINRSERNDFGVKTLNLSDTKTFLKHFYGLNFSPIPDRYMHFFEKGESAQMDQAMLKEEVALMPENNGLSGLTNKMNYSLDVLRNIFHQKGIIITFSGVDGAGKSTIIAHTKKELEKKLRKKVVVIRHRPSVLPILSAITQGKEKAELKAANTLPRQGQNNNWVSSLLRFGYYYTDYLFGQFYVYIRHVMRGEVVLYDRYYFDFISDSLRSNIRLPKWLTKAGYKLLLQPHLNFFLFADVQTILNRKKELDAEAIATLTKDYLNLFTELEKKTQGKYFPIENLQLHETMAIITSKAQIQLI
jgi:thymidylate kinase